MGTRAKRKAIFVNTGLLSMNPSLLSTIHLRSYLTIPNIQKKNTGKLSSAHLRSAELSLYALWKKSKTRSVSSLHAAQRRMKSETMKKTPVTKSRKVAEMAKEYRFDYSKAKPNRFASRMKDSPLVAVIDADVSKVFKTAEQVNSALRALISAMPSRGQAK